MENNPNIIEWFRKGVKDEFTGSASVLDGSDLAYQAYSLGAKLASEKRVPRGTRLTDEEIYFYIADYDFRKHYLNE